MKDTPVHTRPPHHPPGRRHRDENGCGNSGLGLAVIALGGLAAWVFLHGKAGGGYVPPPPPPPPTLHETAADHADLWSFGGFFALLLGVPFASAALIALLRSLSPGKRLRFAVLDDTLLWAGVSGAAGTVLGGLAHWFLGPDTGHLTSSRDILLSRLPWQTGAAVLSAFVVLVLHWRDGGWDRHLYPDPNADPDVDRDTRSRVRELARQASVPLRTAIAWHTTVGYRNAFGDGHRNPFGDGHLQHVRSGNLAEWGALIGPDAPAWAAAGFTLDDAAWLAALPPWHPNRPTPDTLAEAGRLRREQDEHDQRDLDAARLDTLGVLADGPDGQERCAAYRAHGYSPDNDRCVAGARCPSHDPAFLKALTAEVTW